MFEHCSNHGFYNRTGRNIHLDKVVDVMSKIYPVGVEFLREIPIQGAIDSGLVATQPINLDMFGVMDHHTSGPSY